MEGHDQLIKSGMEGQDQLIKSRVVKVDSEESWDFFLDQANNQGCPVVVHFTASWCAPSVAMNPNFEELALNYQDILFLVVDVDDVKKHDVTETKVVVIGDGLATPALTSQWLMAVASRMEVKAMPTFVLMKDGTQIDKLVGANPEEIRKRIDSFARSIRSHKQM